MKTITYVTGNKAKIESAKNALVPLGYEAFVFFVNSGNPVTGLTTDQIRDIYAGNITNWSEVGGPSMPINNMTRVPGSGSQTMMEAFMGDTPIAPRRLSAVFGGGLGYSFRFYLSGMVYRYRRRRCAGQLCTR